MFVAVEGKTEATQKDIIRRDKATWCEDNKQVFYNVQTSTMEVAANGESEDKSKTKY